MTKSAISKTDHKTIMTKILIDIYKDKYLSNKLGFKGGTACYFFYNLPRFSVDLDFNLLQNVDVSATISDILEKYGQIKDSSTKRNTLFWLLNHQKGQWNLKVEVSTRQYGDEFEIKDFYGTPVLVMKKEYIFAHKLVAITDRRNPVGRDLFDIHYFLTNNWKFKGGIIESRTGMKPRKYLQSLIDFIDRNFTNKILFDGLGELMTQSQRDSAKVKLLDNVKQELAVFLDNIDYYVVT